jgi:uncharacterized protein with ATP-grasp and redox domains
LEEERKGDLLKPQLECTPCILKWVYERAGVLASEEKRFQLARTILSSLSQELYPGTNLASISNKILSAIDEFMQDTAEYYQGFKKKSNQLAKELLPVAQDFIGKGKTPEENLRRACLLASASNVAPIGAPSEVFKFQEVIDILEGRSPLPIIMGDVFRAAEGAKEILYVTDNAGEIGFDSLLISKLKEMGSKINLLVKEEPFFEDATTKDALFFGMDRTVDRLLTVKGIFVPRESSPSLTEVLKKTDLVIAKGTGNYEALKGEPEVKSAFYLLKVKCQAIATDIGVPLGSFVVKAEK